MPSESSMERMLPVGQPTSVLGIHHTKHIQANLSASVSFPVDLLEEADATTRLAGVLWQSASQFPADALVLSLLTALRTRRQPARASTDTAPAAKQGRVARSRTGAARVDVVPARVAMAAAVAVALAADGGVVGRRDQRGQSGRAVARVRRKRSSTPRWRTTSTMVAAPRARMLRRTAAGPPRRWATIST